LILPSAPPGSILWLLGNELRLSFRGMKRGGARMWIVIGVLVLLMLVVGGPMAFFLGHVTIGETPAVIMMFDLVLLAVFTLILSQTLSATVIGFFERGDLDLLLSSPLPPRRILTVRALAIAIAPLLWFVGLATILVIPAALAGQFRWLTVYPVLAALGLLASAAGISLAMALFRLIGARRTRAVGQIMAALIGAAFFMTGQLRNMLPDRGRQLFAGVSGWADSGVFEPSSPLSWPARAVLGDLVPLVVFVGGSALLFAAVVAGLGRRFASDAGLAAGVGAGRSRATGRKVSARAFEGGPDATLIRKELRLLLRDATLLSQVLLRLLYVIPLGFAVIRGASRQQPGADALGSAQLIGLTVVLVFMAGQLAGSLAWITVSAEDAPELLACAPVDGGRVRRAKLAAAMIPVAVLLGPLLLVLIGLSPWVGVCALAGAAGSSVSAGLINLWFEKPASRKTFRGRRTGSVIGSVIEVLVGMGWGATAGLASAGWYWALAPLAITVGLLVLASTVANPTRGY